MTLQVPSQSTASATGNPRNKTALKPGRSLMDWVRLTKSGADLSGTRGRKIEVTVEELQKHNKLDDMWMAIKGVVYNVTPYVEFHPGGVEELMRGAGQDSTDLFNEVHRWVNIESMLEKCVVGKLVPSFVKPALPSKVESTAPAIKVPSTPPIKAVRQVAQPTFDWFQTPEILSLCIYTRTRNVQPCDITFDVTPVTFSAYVKTSAGIFVINLEFSHEIVPKCIPKVLVKTGKVEFVLSKCVKQLWQSCGQPQSSHCHLLTENVSRKAKLVCREKVTHNTWKMAFQLPESSWINVPIGGHVTLGLELENKLLTAKYTPIISSLLDEGNSVPDSENKMHFLIKVYPNGVFTPKLRDIFLDDEVLVSAPENVFDAEKLEKCERLCCLAAGTGITPMVRLMKEALRKGRECYVDLHFWNRTEKDILLRNELDSLVVSSASRLTVDYILTSLSEESVGSRGRVSLEYLRCRLRQSTAMPSSDNILICVCGPTEFTTTCLGYLTELGYPESAVHAFLG